MTSSLKLKVFGWRWLGYDGKELQLENIGPVVSSSLLSSVLEKLLKTDNSLFYLHVRQNDLNLDVFNYRVFVCDKKVLCFNISTD